MGDAIGFYRDSKGRTRPVTVRKFVSSDAISRHSQILITKALNEGKTVTYYLEQDDGRIRGVEGVDAVPFNSLSQFGNWVKTVYRVSDDDYIGGDFRSDSYRLDPDITTISGKKTIHFYGSMGSLEVRLE